MGVIERISRKKLALARKFYTVAGKSGMHTRLLGLDKETNKELLLRHIRESGKNGAPFNEMQQVLPGHSRGQIQRLLKELRADGKIHLTGKTLGARWFFEG